MKANGLVLFVVAGLLVLAGVVTGLVAVGCPPWVACSPADPPVTQAAADQPPSTRLADALDGLTAVLAGLAPAPRAGSADRWTAESAGGTPFEAAAIRALPAALPAVAPVGGC
jgi:hypothetical protein